MIFLVVANFVKTAVFALVALVVVLSVALGYYMRKSKK